MNEARLPQGFETLEPFVDRWSVAGSAARTTLRSNSDPAEREAFFAAASPLLDAMLAHLDAHSLDSLPPAENRLMDLTLSLAHIAIAVEIQGSDEPKLAPWRDKMTITRSPAGA